MLHGFKKVAPAQRFTAWSPSRLDDYEQCPYKAKLKHLDKLCPKCFKGALTGGYNSPAVCDTCNETIVKGEALERGTVIGDRLDAYLKGEEKTPGPTVAHPKVKEIVKKAKADVKAGRGDVQVSVNLTRDWKLWTGPGWSPNVWLRAKLDFRRVVGALAHVTDWKTGGCEKKGPEAGKVKVVDKYDDQLLVYKVVTLSTLPKVEAATSDLVFLDCGPGYDPVVDRGGLVRADLKAAQDKLTRKVLPMLSDDTFAPRASYLCNYCDFRKSAGGPCRLG